MEIRRVLLLGNNATRISDEKHLELFAGKSIQTGGVLLDEGHKRAYQIRAVTPATISVREIPVTPLQIRSLRPLDDTRAIGNLREFNVRIEARKDRETGRWKRA